MALRKFVKIVSENSTWTVNIIAVKFTQIIWNEFLCLTFSYFIEAVHRKLYTFLTLLRIKIHRCLINLEFFTLFVLRELGSATLTVVFFSHYLKFKFKLNIDLWFLSIMSFADKNMISTSIPMAIRHPFLLQ